MSYQLRAKFFLSLAMLIVGSINICDAQNKWLSTSKMIDDFDNAYLALLTYHPKVNDAADSAKVKNTFTKLKARIDSSTTKEQFGKYVGELISTVEDGHTGLLDADAMRNGTVYLPFDVAWIEGQFVITKSYEKDITVGQILISIDGISADSIHKETLLYQGSGDNQSTIDKQKIKNCTHMHLRFHNRGKDAKRSIIVLQDSSKNLDTVTVAAKTSTGYSFLTGLFNDEDNTRGEMLGTDSLITVMRVPSFMSMFQRSDIDKAVKLARKAKYVILDLRNNPGGLVGTSSYLLSYLISQDITSLKNARIKTACKDLLDGTAASFGAKGSVLKALQKAKTPWVELIDVMQDSDIEDIIGRIDSVPDNITDKEIVVLVNENTYSAGAIVAMALKAKGRKLIGQHPSNDNCALNALYIEEVELANSGFVIMLPIISAEFNRKQCVSGNLQADIVVTPKLDDVRNQKDTVLEFAEKYCRELEQKSKKTLPPPAKKP
jgi:C-terminal processing protease CtpA/Prc